MSKGLEPIFQYLVNPLHPISILLVGAGGTGSEVIRHLAKMHGSLIGLGHPGFFVTVSDPDTIGIENLFRQPYTPREIGLFKASQLVSRVNETYGTQWQSAFYDWEDKDNKKDYNIVISCVDKISVRRTIEKRVYKTNSSQPYAKGLLWMDFGNGFDFGQVILSDTYSLKDKILKNVFDIYPKAIDPAEEPSCSLAMSLGKQDLFINSIVPDLGMRMLWSIIRKAKIEYNCIFVNLKEAIPVRTALMLKNEKKESKASTVKPAVRRTKASRKEKVNVH